MDRHSQLHVVSIWDIGVLHGSRDVDVGPVEASTNRRGNETEKVGRHMCSITAAAAVHRWGYSTRGSSIENGHVTLESLSRAGGESRKADNELVKSNAHLNNLCLRHVSNCCSCALSALVLQLESRACQDRACSRCPHVHNQHRCPHKSNPKLTVVGLKASAILCRRSHLP